MGMWDRHKVRDKQRGNLAGELVDAEKLRAARQRVVAIQHELHQAERAQAQVCLCVSACMRINSCV